MFIDSHCHLEPGDFRAPDGSDERPEVLRRAAAAGVGHLIVIGSGRGRDEVDNAVALANAHDHIHATVGVHPHDACNLVDPDGGEAPGSADLWAHIVHVARTEPRVVAIGETGLDFHYKHSTPVQQRALLRRFLRLAHQVQKPVTLHIRDAHAEVQALVLEARAEGAAPPGGIVHCFTGNKEEAAAWLDLGYDISLSGIVTFKSAAPIQEACKLIPGDRLHLETDCPYLAPVPLRGKRNEPAFLTHTAAFVARLRGVDVDQIAAESATATRRLFQLDRRNRS